MRITFNEKGELVAWGLGGTLPSELPLTPTSPVELLADGFAYGERDFRLEFLIDRGRVRGLVLKGSNGPVSAKRVR